MLKIIIPNSDAKSNIAVMAQNIHDGALAAECDAQILDIARGIDLSDTVQASGIIFGSPTYFGSVSADMKAFFDSTVALFDKGAWRNKIAAGFTNSFCASGDKLQAIVNISIFAAQHGMLWAGLDLRSGECLLDDELRDKLRIPKDMQLNKVGSWLGLMSFGVLEESDLATARYMGYRLGRIVSACKINSI